MIDIHTHIIPGVDDGSKSLKESIEIIREAIDDGVETIVATPHILEMSYQDNWQKIKSAFNDLKQRLTLKNIDIVLGAELSISPDLPKMVMENTELTINGKNKYILLELPSLEVPSFTEQIIFDLLLHGIIPIIAHPERCVGVYKDPEKLVVLVQKGALTQVNSGSLTGKYGRKVRNAAKALLTCNLIHMISSDVHSTNNKQYTLSQGVNITAKIVGIDRAREMVTSIPEMVIKGERVEVLPPEPIEKKGIFKRYFS